MGVWKFVDFSTNSSGHDEGNPSISLGTSTRSIADILGPEDGEIFSMFDCRFSSSSSSPISLIIVLANTAEICCFLEVDKRLA